MRKEIGAKELNIHSIYRATEGEGIFLGTPQLFVRFQGCAVGCLNCDSKETWSFRPNQLLTLESVLKQIDELSFGGKIKRISLTGGDPLHESHRAGLMALIAALKETGHYINIEAAGTQVVDSVFDLVDYISFDLKTPSTGVLARENDLLQMGRQYGQKTQFKAVVANRRDFDFVLGLYQNLKKSMENRAQNDISWCLTPCYEPRQDFPQELFISVMDWNMAEGAPFRVIGQQHKWVFGPNKTNI